MATMKTDMLASVASSMKDRAGASPGNGHPASPSSLAHGARAGDVSKPPP